LPTAGLLAVGLRARRDRPEARHATGQRTSPSRLVPTIRGRFPVDAVHRLGSYGHRNWIPGGTHDGVHRRDQRTGHPRHVVYVRQYVRRPGTPARVYARVFILVEGSNAHQLSGACDCFRRYISGTTVNYFLFLFLGLGLIKNTSTYRKYVYQKCTK